MVPEDTVPTNVYTEQLFKAPYSTVRQSFLEWMLSTMVAQTQATSRVAP